MLNHLIAAAGLAAVLFGTGATAVTHGDEQYQDVRDGKFLVLLNGPNTGTSRAPVYLEPAIDVVDPLTMTRVTTIAINYTDHGLDPASFAGWSDAAYAERNCAAAQAQLLMANTRGGTIVVVDTAVEEVVSIVASGSGHRYVHGYVIPEYQEFWAHADDTAEFDVLHYGKSLTELEHEAITAMVGDPGHGKLLWDPDTLPIGYASNTREGFLYQLDLEEPVMKQHWNISGMGHTTCGGTHGLAYSSTNKHVYATCSQAGLLEFDPEAGAVVAMHAPMTGGQVYSSHDGKYLVDIDKYNSQIHLLTPGATGGASDTIFAPVKIPDGVSESPDKPAFLSYKYRGKDGNLHVMDRIFSGLTKPNTMDGVGSGFAVIDTCEVEAEPERAHTLSIVPAGNIVSSGTYTYRTIKRGGLWVAVPTDYAPPEAGLSDGSAAVSLMHALTLDVSYVELSASSPKAAYWAPKRCGAVPDDKPLMVDCSAPIKDRFNTASTPDGNSDNGKGDDGTTAAGAPTTTVQTTANAESGSEAVAFGGVAAVVVATANFL